MGSFKPLQDIRVLFTFLKAEEKEYLTKLARQEGAVVLSSPSPVDPPHVLIARRVATSKYHLVRRINRKIPVVIPEWLTSSVQAGKLLPYDEFQVSMFHGLTICFSGLSVGEKNRLAKEVTSRGAKHSPMLSKACSHLVTVTTDSDKFRFAQEQKIPCVLPAWLEESIEAGWCLEEKRYAIDKGSALLLNDTSIHQTTISGRERDVLASVGRDGMACRDISTTIHPTEKPSSKGTQNSFLHVEGNEDTVLEHNFSDKSKFEVSDERTSPKHDGHKEADVPNTKDTVHSLNESDLSCDEEDFDGTLSLETCYIWCVGVSESELLEVMKLCRASGAKRFEELHPDLTTHILFGSSTGAAERDRAQKYLETHFNAVVVNLDWLRCSVLQKKPLPLSSTFATVGTCNGNESMSRGLVTSCDISAKPKAAELVATSFCPEDNRGLTIENHNGNGESASFSADNSSQREFTLERGFQDSHPICLKGGQSTLPYDGVFSGCYFTLAAIRGTSEESISEKLIRSHGGRLFTASFPANCRAFAICPSSLPTSVAYSLRNSHPDFASVPETDRYTFYWLECCIISKTIISPSRGSPCLQPLPYPLPLPGMDGVSVVVSGYDPTTRESIFRTVETLGGRVSREFMSTRDTHLLLPYAWGRKFEHADRMGVKPATADWLIDTVAFGSIQPTDPYRPPQHPRAQQNSQNDADNMMRVAAGDALPRGHVEDSNASRIALSQADAMGKVSARSSLQGKGQAENSTSLFQRVIAGPREDNNTFLQTDGDKIEDVNPDKPKKKLNLIEKLKRIRDQAQGSAEKQASQKSQQRGDVGPKLRLISMDDSHSRSKFDIMKGDNSSTLDSILRSQSGFERERDSRNISQGQNKLHCRAGALISLPVRKVEDINSRWNVSYETRKTDADHAQDSTKVGGRQHVAVVKSQRDETRFRPKRFGSQDHGKRSTMSLEMWSEVSLLEDKNAVFGKADDVQQLNEDVQGDGMSVEPQSIDVDLETAVDGIKSMLERKHRARGKKEENEEGTKMGDIDAPMGTQLELEVLKSTRRLSWDGKSTIRKKRRRNDSDNENSDVGSGSLPRRSSRLSNKRKEANEKAESDADHTDMPSQKVGYDVTPADDSSLPKLPSSTAAIKRRLQRAVARHQTTKA